MVSVSVYQVGHPGANPKRSIFFERWNSTGMISALVASAADCFTKGCTMCYLVYMAVDSLLSVVRVGNGVPVSRLWLSLFSLHVLNRDVNMISA